MKNLTKQRIIFWLSLIFLCVLAFFIYTNKIEFSKLNKALSINLQQLFILLTLGGIVGTLYFSKKYVIKLRGEKDRELRVKKYNSMVYLRLVIFNILCLLCLGIHLFTISSGSYLIFGMIIIMFLFIWPSKSRAIYENKSEEEIETEVDAEDIDNEEKIKKNL